MPLTGIAAILELLVEARGGLYTPYEIASRLGETDIEAVDALAHLRRAELAREVDGCWLATRAAIDAFDLAKLLPGFVDSLPRTG
jgi:hypothetical protein